MDVNVSLEKKIADSFFKCPSQKSNGCQSASNVQNYLNGSIHQESFDWGNDILYIFCTNFGLTTAQFKVQLSKTIKGSGGGSVGWAVAFDTRDPQFESQHLQSFISQS